MVGFSFDKSSNDKRLLIQIKVQNNQPNSQTFQNLGLSISPITHYKISKLTAMR